MSMTETSAPVEHLDRGPRTKDELAAAVAAAIPPGSYVNLGIGQPTTVADFLTPESGSRWSATWVGWPMPRLTNDPAGMSRATRAAISSRESGPRSRCSIMRPPPGRRRCRA